MKETIAAWAMGLISAFGGAGLLLFALKKFGPPLINKYLGKFVGMAIDYDEKDPLKNEARKRMILANMVYLELEIPDRGKGEERKKRLVAMLGDKAGPIIDELISQLDDAMKSLTEKQSK